MTSLPFFSDGFRTFMYNNLFIVPFVSIIAIVVECAIICSKDVARKVPNNYICLGIFTFCEAYIVAFTASVYDPMIVLTAAIMTAGVVIALTIYAWKTKKDFTLMGSAMAILSVSLLMCLIFSLIFINQIIPIILCMLIVIMFGFYIVYDTQLIIGEKRYEINEEDYVIGALILYLDIITMFIYILRILGEAQRNN